MEIYMLLVWFEHRRSANTLNIIMGWLNKHVKNNNDAYLTTSKKALEIKFNLLVLDNCQTCF